MQAQFDMSAFGPNVALEKAGDVRPVSSEGPLPNWGVLQGPVNGPIFFPGFQREETSEESFPMRNPAATNRVVLLRDGNAKGKAGLRVVNADPSMLSSFHPGVKAFKVVNAMEGKNAPRLKFRVVSVDTMSSSSVANVLARKPAIRRPKGNTKASNRGPRPALGVVNMNIPKDKDNGKPAFPSPTKAIAGKENGQKKVFNVRRKPVPRFSALPSPVRKEPIRKEPVRKQKHSSGFPSFSSEESFPFRKGEDYSSIVCRKGVTVIRNLEVLQVVGRGGFGKVYVAKKLGGQVGHVAVKVVSKAAVHRNPEMILLEQELLKRVRNHQHLLNMVGSFHDSHNFYIVTDYHQGGDLSRLLSRFKKLDVEATRFYAAEMLSGINHLHANGILHRDIKLSNTLLKNDGHICIADLGLCRDFGSKTFIKADEGASDFSLSFCGDPVTASIAGTVVYMSPEAISGSFYSYEADVWSYGICVYQMLEGEVPWRDECPLELRDMIMGASLPYTSNIDLDVNAKSFLDDLMRKELDNRLYQIPFVKKHAFFSAINFDDVDKGLLQPPYMPQPIPSFGKLNNWDRVFAGSAFSEDCDPYPDFEFINEPQEKVQIVADSKVEESPCREYLKSSPFVRPPAPEPFSISGSKLKYSGKPMDSSSVDNLPVAADLFTSLTSNPFYQPAHESGFLDLNVDSSQSNSSNSNPLVDDIAADTPAGSPALVVTPGCTTMDSSECVAVFEGTPVKIDAFLVPETPEAAIVPQTVALPAAIPVAIPELVTDKTAEVSFVEIHISLHLCDDKIPTAEDEPRLVSKWSDDTLDLLASGSFWTNCKDNLNSWFSNIGKKITQGLTWARDCLFGRKFKEESPV